MNTLHVSDIMTRAVITVKESATVKLGKLEMEVAGIRHMPVVDSAGRVVGVVALGDLLVGLASAGEEGIAIRAVMKRRVLTIHETAPAADAATTMLENKVGSLPVLGDGDKLVGMITETDFLRVAEKALRQGVVAKP